MNVGTNLPLPSFFAKRWLPVEPSWFTAPVARVVDGQSHMEACQSVMQFPPARVVAAGARA
jgi:hypothetical protein